jgi:hypothetical protein
VVDPELDCIDSNKIPLKTKPLEAILAIVMVLILSPSVITQTIYIQERISTIIKERVV